MNNIPVREYDEISHFKPQIHYLPNRLTVKAPVLPARVLFPSWAVQLTGCVWRPAPARIAPARRLSPCRGSAPASCAASPMQRDS